MITGNLNYGMPWPAFERLQVIPAMAKRLIKYAGLSNGPPLMARINHGRWVVDCECNGAELAFDEGIFMCQSCYNAGTRHQTRLVVFPKNRQAIETALLQRPEPNRNWYPGETVTKLLAENKAHKEELL